MKRIIFASLSILLMPVLIAPAINAAPQVEQNTVSKQSSSPLAKELQGKPLVVKIEANWCGACQQLKSVMASLQEQYGNDANFVVFDVSDRATTEASEAKAEQLGLADFFAAHKSQTATIAVINPSNGQIIEQFQKNFNEQDYVNAIESAIAQVRQNN